MTLTRTVFCLSMTATVFWIFGFVAEQISKAEPPFWSYTLPALLFSAVVALVAFRKWPHFLELQLGPKTPFVLSFLLWTILTYAVGVLVLGVIGYLLLKINFEASDPMRGEAELVAYILALWFPLWFAPAVGTSVAWWRQATARSNSTIDRYARNSSARPSS